MSKRYVFADPFLEWLPGPARQFIRRFKLKPGDRVVLVCRVSERAQGHKGNHYAQEAYLTKLVSERGGIVVASVLYVGSGCDLDRLEEACTLARQHNATILAESTDRLIRNRYYHSSKNPDAQATLADLKRLKRATKGVRLMTYLDPEASPSEVRAQHRRRGKIISGNLGGRGHTKKRRRKFYRPTFDAGLANRLRKHLDAGLSVKEIARRMRRSASTIYDWKRGLTTAIS